MQEIRIAAIGNVDSAKSTTISCIANNIKDNGRGFARSKIFKHKHEQETGRTSSLTQYYTNINDKVLGFIDLAGHEKYLKTTMSGLTGCLLDYSMVTIGGERGIVGMTKEHISLSLGLNIPLFFVITKIDIAPEDKIDTIINKIKKIMATRAAGYRNAIVIKDNYDSVYLEDWHIKKVFPIFLISNKTGYNLNNLRDFIYKLPSRFLWNTDSINLNKNKTFCIDDVFKVKGVGLVLSGYVKEGRVSVDDKLYVGPFDGIYKKIIIKSIHNNFRTNVNSLSIGQSGCLNIRFTEQKNVSKTDILRGMIVTKNYVSVREFEANVLIIKNTTTIKCKYEPIIHCGTVRQSAKICNMDKDLLRSGDVANIHFRFMFRPEFVEKGCKIVFREGNTKGIGKITKIIK